MVVEAFRWSLALIAKILVRTISEGSTLAPLSHRLVEAVCLKDLQAEISTWLSVSWCTRL